jgi:hypothetical protein
LAAPVAAVFPRLARRGRSGRFFEPAQGKRAPLVKTGRAAFHLFFTLKKTVATLAGVQFALAIIAKGLVGRVCHGGFLPDFGFMDSLMNGWL